MPLALDTFFLWVFEVRVAVEDVRFGIVGMDDVRGALLLLPWDVADMILFLEAFQVRVAVEEGCIVAEGGGIEGMDDLGGHLPWALADMILFLEAFEVGVAAEEGCIVAEEGGIVGSMGVGAPLPWKEKRIYAME